MVVFKALKESKTIFGAFVDVPSSPPQKKHWVRQENNILEILLLKLLLLENEEKDVKVPKISFSLIFL